MRIAHVVTLVSPDGAYGGPLRVAVNQAKALILAGHEVTIFAGTRGYSNPPTEIDGVPIVLHRVFSVLPRSGFAGLVSPGLLRALRASATGFDIIHVHLARDLVTLLAARLAMHAGLRFVVQTHGMIDRSTRLLAKPIDALLTRPLLAGAAAVFFLTDLEASELRHVTPAPLNLVRLPNGVPVALPEQSPRARDTPEVLFLARLQRRKRGVLFARMAVVLAPEFPNARFTIVGPDEGEGGAVLATIAESGVADQVEWKGALPPDETLGRLRAAAIYVLPSVDEPFPMSVLEAMSVGVPVVITESNGLAEAVRRGGAGIVIGETLDELVTAVRSLLADPIARGELGQRALNLAREEFSMDAIAERLESTYQVERAERT